MLSSETIRKFHQLGQKACANYAPGMNVGNANSFAAETLANHIGYKKINGTTGVLLVMQRGKIDLSSLLGLDDDEFDQGCAAFAGGCYAWLETNPD
jgi:hypothetical protein